MAGVRDGGAEGRGSDVRRVSSRNIKNAFKFRAIKNSGLKFHCGQGIEDASSLGDVRRYKICSQHFRSSSLQSAAHFLIKIPYKITCRLINNEGTGEYLQRIERALLGTRLAHCIEDPLKVHLYLYTIIYY